MTTNLQNASRDKWLRENAPRLAAMDLNAVAKEMIRVGLYSSSNGLGDLRLAIGRKCGRMGIETLKGTK